MHLLIIILGQYWHKYWIYCAWKPWNMRIPPHIFRYDRCANTDFAPIEICYLFIFFLDIVRVYIRNANAIYLWHLLLACQCWSNEMPYYNSLQQAIYTVDESGREKKWFCLRLRPAAIHTFLLVFRFYRPKKTTTTTTIFFSLLLSVQGLRTGTSPSVEHKINSRCEFDWWRVSAIFYWSVHKVLAWNFFSAAFFYLSLLWWIWLLLLPFVATHEGRRSRVNSTRSRIMMMSKSRSVEYNAIYMRAAIGYRQRVVGLFEVIFFFAMNAEIEDTFCEHMFVFHCLKCSGPMKQRNNSNDWPRPIRRMASSWAGAYISRMRASFGWK